MTVDGVSLTVVKPLGDGFTMAIIPHTSAVTTLGTKQRGDLVNIEADVIAKYVERMLRPHLTTTASTGECRSSNTFVTRVRSTDDDGAVRFD